MTGEKASTESEKLKAQYNHACMSVTVSAPVTAVERPLPIQQRLLSLDVFRGATIAAMILVNNPGSSAAFAPLKHADWDGWTPTDLIFPFFLFIVGVSLVFSSDSRLAHGASRRELVLHTLQRAAIIFGIGFALNFLFQPHLATVRIPGVLQRIAVAYLAAALITLYTGARGRIIWIAALLIGYWLVMCYLPVPGYGVPGHQLRLLHPDHNLAAWLDRKLMFGHLFERTRDPEGLLSTLPAIATVLCGVLTGQWLRSRRTPRQKAAWMLGYGVAGLLAGELWNVWFPINKKLWTSSFVLLTAGCALVALALCYWVCDVKLFRRWWSKPLIVFGSNAIAAYVLADVLSSLLYGWRIHSGHKILTLQDYLYRTSFSGIPSKPFGSLLYSIGFVVICWLPVDWMCRKRIFLKV